MKVLLAALFFLIPLSAAADTGHGKFTKHKSRSFFMVTGKKHFSIEMELDGNELKEGSNRATIVIHDRSDRDVKGAKIALTPWMPGMGHGVPEKAVVTEKEVMFGSTYLVENLVINMEGHWEIQVDVEKDGVRDGAVFDFPDVGGEGEGGMKEMRRSRPESLDLSSTLPSSKSIFTVSYESNPAQPPLNRIHSWKLSVKTASGEPVEGATVMVSGDMPEHGHGLPTKPEATEEVGAGVYLIEGIKFSMSGWWEVSFHIRGDVQEDNVTFNLLLR